MRDFVSNLAGKLNDFLDYKHALGIKYDTCRVYLLELDGYNLEHGNRDTLTKEMTEGWAIWHAGKSESQNRSWIPPIREFGRYLQSIGEKDAYVLDDRFSIQHYHAEVYLMSTDEIQAFFRECDSYVLRTKVPGRPYVLPALYRFLYCCGVRCVEARKLKCINVHLKDGYVDILDTKSHKDRRLYLSEELSSYLARYDKAVSACFPEREYFFPGAKGGICSKTAVSANFRKIWVSAGLKRDGKVKPRAYDFSYPNHYIIQTLSGICANTAYVLLKKFGFYFPLWYALFKNTKEVLLWIYHIYRHITRNCSSTWSKKTILELISISFARKLSIS